MDFIKMHGTRNSYLFFEGDIDDPSGVSRRLSHEYGSDGIILILPSDICDYRMRIFNADGSEARDAHIFRIAAAYELFVTADIVCGECGTAGYALFIRHLLSWLCKRDRCEEPCAECGRHPS